MHCNFNTVAEMEEYLEKKLILFEFLAYTCMLHNILSSFVAFFKSQNRYHINHIIGSKLNIFFSYKYSEMRSKL